MAFAPPPLAFNRSGARDAIARRTGSHELRDVSAVRCSARAAAARIGGHHGGTSWRSARSHAQPATVAAYSVSNGRPAGGTARPWSRFQVSTRTVARTLGPGT